MAQADFQNIVDRFFIAHIEDIAHIYFLPINSTTCKFQITLKWYFLCRVLSGKAGAIGLAELTRVMHNGSFEKYYSFILFFFTIRKCGIVLRATLLCQFISGKALNYKTGTIVIVIFQKP